MIEPQIIDPEQLERFADVRQSGGLLSNAPGAHSSDSSSTNLPRDWPARLCSASPVHQGAPNSLAGHQTGRRPLRGRSFGHRRAIRQLAGHSESQGVGEQLRLDRLLRRLVGTTILRREGNSIEYRLKEKINTTSTTSENSLFCCRCGRELRHRLGLSEESGQVGK